MDITFPYSNNTFLTSTVCYAMRRLVLDLISCFQNSENHGLRFQLKENSLLTHPLHKLEVWGFIVVVLCSFVFNVFLTEYERFIQTFQINQLRRES